MASATPTPTQPGAGHQSQASTSSMPTSPPNKRDLKSWWKGFKLAPKHQEQPVETKPTGIFGVPLRQSIQYANVAISLIDENGQSYIYGYVPIVVAKCGVFLKEKATNVQGIFRLNGSEKRIKELKHIFDSPDRYGKGLSWEGYQVHDAATVLRRYLNDLPEPVVPLSLYEKFRHPLRGATKQAVGDAEGPQFVDNFDEKGAIEKYQALITELPPLNRQLLLYILDLLAVFAAKADENRMNSQNLSAIFQPGILSHPDHAMAPEEYRLNQCVLIFLIENQDHFLIGMQGTAADENTKKEVELGAVAVTPSTPTNRKSGLGRSASNASAGAESVRKEGKIRRNRSVTSRNSKHDSNNGADSPGLVTTPSGGLARSNTVPSKKSPAIGSSKFKNQSPAAVEPLTKAHITEEMAPSDQSSIPPGAAMPTNELSPGSTKTADRSQERLLDVPEAATPSKERNLGSIFQRSPGDEKRQPNKLKKKRIPGSLNPSAQSSSASLGQGHTSTLSPNAMSPNAEARNPIEVIQPAVHLQPESQTQPPSMVQQNSDLSSEPTPRASEVPAAATLQPEGPFRGSPPRSISSSHHDASDLDQMQDDSTAATDSSAKEKKLIWRRSRQKKEDGPASASSPTTSPGSTHLGSNENADVSMTSIGSSAQKPRKSSTGDNPDVAPTFATSGTGSESLNKDGKDDSKGPIGWIRNKYREAKENADHKRNKSPSADRGIGLVSRGKSVDIKREKPDEQAEETPAQVKAPMDAPVAEPQTTEPTLTSGDQVQSLEQSQQQPEVAKP